MFWKYLNVAYLPAHIRKYSKRNRIHLKADQVQVRISTAQGAGAPVDGVRRRQSEISHNKNIRRLHAWDD